MGMTRKILSICTLGLIKFRSNREVEARAKLISAKADRDRVKMDREALAQHNRRMLGLPPEG